MGTACYVKRSAAIVAALQKEFGVEPGKATSDGKLSLATARCLGSCGLAPAVVLDGEVLGLETVETTLAQVRRAVEGSHGPQTIEGTTTS
jgi:bidirectional [NiFe] hydrogenase diaphorase subunit